MGYLTRDAILAAEDLRRTEVEVPEWGGSIILRELTGAERDQFEQSMVEQRGTKYELRLRNARARLVALCAVDEQGTRLFSHADVELLGKKSGRVLDRLFDAAATLSGIQAGQFEEMVQGFESGQSGDSGSG